MKKKIIKGLCLLLMVLNLTGCVKFNVNIGINKDKSMDFSMIYAIDSQFLKEQQIFNEEELNNIKNNGFNVENYDNNSMKGVKLTRIIPNIDLVSTIANYTEFDLAGITKEKQDSFLFKINKGFFKNKYTAKIKFDSSESNLPTEMNPGDNEIDNDNTENNLEDNKTEDNGGDVINFTEDDNKIIFIENDENVDNDGESENNSNENNQNDGNDDTSFDLDSNIDFSQAIANMDLSIKVTLPYSAISHNATIANNDNKELTWTLSNNGTQYMEFEFELYNMTTIYIVCGGAGLGIILLGLLIGLVIKKKKNTKNINNNLNVNIASEQNNSQESKNNNLTSINVQSMNNINGTNQGINSLEEKANDYIDVIPNTNDNVPQTDEVIKNIEGIQKNNLEDNKNVITTPINNNLVNNNVRTNVNIEKQAMDNIPSNNGLPNQNNNTNLGYNFQKVEQVDNNTASVNPGINNLTNKQNNLSVVTNNNIQGNNKLINSNNSYQSNVMQNSMTTSVNGKNSLPNNNISINNASVITETNKLNINQVIGSYIHIPGQGDNSHENTYNNLQKTTPTNNSGTIVNNASNVQNPTPVMVDPNFTNIVNKQNNLNN